MTPSAPIDDPLRIALVAPVAQSVPPSGSGSVESLTALLAEGLVARGHDVTLYATAASQTPAKLHSIYPRGYHDDPTMWPWELCELFNLAAAVEHARSFDLIHYQAEYAPLSLAFSRLGSIPILQTLHHLPSSTEVSLWSQYSEAPWVAVSRAQARSMDGLNVVSIIHHAVDPGRYSFRASPDDYLLFLGRFTAGKGVLQAIEIARRTGLRLVLAAPPNAYFHDVVEPQVDGAQIVYVGEVDHQAKVNLLGGARALVYPVQDGEPFGLVLIEAMACGTPVAALARGAVTEIVESGHTGEAYPSVDALVANLPTVMALERTRVRERMVARFNPDRFVDAHVEVYRRLRTSSAAAAPSPVSA